MDKLRVAIVGCGNVSKRHFEAAFNNENSVLVACCDNVVCTCYAICEPCECCSKKHCEAKEQS